MNEAHLSAIQTYLKLIYQQLKRIADSIAGPEKKEEGKKE